MTTMSVVGECFFFVPAHPGCPRQIPQSRKMVVCVSVTSSIRKCKHVSITAVTVAASADGYTLCECVQKKRCHNIFCSNFVNCWSIFTILSTIDSAVNFQQSNNKISNHFWNASLHYLLKHPCQKKHINLRIVTVNTLQGNTATLFRCGEWWDLSLLQQQQPFNDPLYGATKVSQYQKGKPIQVLLKQETVSGSGISWAIRKYAPRPRQISMPASTTQFFTGRCPSCCPINSVKALKARQTFDYYFITNLLPRLL